MHDQNFNEPLMDMFLFETCQILAQLEQIIIDSEKDKDFNKEAINEIFRMMHTIKGSAAMMLFDNIAKLAHSIEDVFFCLRQDKPLNVDCSTLSDLVLEGVDFIKIEIDKIKNGLPADNSADSLVETMKEYLVVLKQDMRPELPQQVPVETQKQQYYIRQVKLEEAEQKNCFKAIIYFEDGCEMENIRAYTILHNLKDITGEYYYIPTDILESDESIKTIRRDGFQIFLKTDRDYKKMNEFFNQTIFLRSLELIQLEDDSEFIKPINEVATIPVMRDGVKLVKEESLHIERVDKEAVSSNSSQSIISVSVTKLDKLMDLVGEMVIAEALVIQNPDLKNLQIANFIKAARQLNKITTEIQNMVMSIRMVPLSVTFNKMHRIVRDMCKRLDKDVHLEIIGEETEVDKNIIEHISDPLMHLVRNSIDHGIEQPQERLALGKPRTGTITLEAINTGSDVQIIVRDDGKGLNKEQILKKARENNLLFKNEEDMSDKEIFNLILLPGFSTKENVTEFSGRGVGMDVVRKNIEKVGGTLFVDSTEGRGTVITLKIPLTLAIIDGMNIKVGRSRYTIPINSIKESFRPKEGDIITDPDGNEMIMVRGQCYLIRRLHKLFMVQTDITKFTDGIILMLDQDEKTVCVFADELLGQQQVVVKALPQYIRNFNKVRGLAGCTLLGDGSISLILDIAGILSYENL